MSHDEVVVHSKANVPFSWEQKPGVSKVRNQTVRPVDKWHFRLKLPPPPPRESKISPGFPLDNNLQVHLTPSDFGQTPSRSFEKDCRMQEDPFLRAYKKCTGYPTTGKSSSDSKTDHGRPQIARRNGGSRSSALSYMSMNHSKTHSKGNVPFSWENKPGESKVTKHQDYIGQETFVIKLEPPPCWKCPIESARISTHDIQIPLPPCMIQAAAGPSRSSSRRGLKKDVDDDPFLAAYKECTKNTKKDKHSRKDLGSGLRKGVLFNFSSCKQSCSFRDDNLVKVSQVPCEREICHHL